MAEPILKSYQLPVIPMVDSGYPEFESQAKISIDLTKVLPQWQQVTAAINNVVNSPNDLIDANYHFSNVLKLLLQNAIDQFEMHNLGYTLGQSMGLRDKIVDDIINSFPIAVELTIEQQSKIIQIIRAAGDFNQMLRKFQRLGYPADKAPNHLTKILTQERIDDTIIPILTETERPLELLISKITGANHSIDNKSLHSDAM